MKLIALSFLFVVLISFLFIACSNDDEGTDTREDNRIAIEAYLTENNLTAQSTESGLYYIVEREGNGTFPNASSSVTATYVGYDLDGNIFDQSSSPFTFGLNQVIAGWQEGIPKFSEGSSGKLFIPSHLAYGGNAPSNNQPIAFDIELLTVN